MLFVCYPKCTTCQKAQRWLDAKGVAYEGEGPVLYVERSTTTSKPAQEVVSF